MLNQLFSNVMTTPNTIIHTGMRMKEKMSPDAPIARDTTTICHFRCHLSDNHMPKTGPNGLKIAMTKV